jgi:hypothetical protein
MTVDVSIKKKPRRLWRWLGGKVLRFASEGNFDIGFRLYDPEMRGLPANGPEERP